MLHGPANVTFLKVLVIISLLVCEEGCFKFYSLRLAHTAISIAIYTCTTISLGLVSDRVIRNLIAD